jgi:hypothetical protein
MAKREIRSFNFNTNDTNLLSTYIHSNVDTFVRVAESNLLDVAKNVFDRLTKTTLENVR